MKEPKKATTYEEQVRILQSRGMIIDDEAFCIQKLSEINYYRFSAYFLPFRRQDGSYIEGVHFQRVYRIYEFDRKLRGILFSAIEEIEIFLKSRLAYFHAHQYGALGYPDPANFSAAHRADKFSGNIQREIQNNNKVLFVKHHIENYDGQFPIWVIVELFTFGMISRFYADMPRSDQKKLAKKIYNTVPQNMVSWLRCVTDLRNICAHYGRLYFRIFSAVPAGLGLQTAAERRLWGAVLALKSLYPDHNKWDAEILPGIQALFEEYQNDIDLYHIAFPKDWDQQLAFSRSI